MMWTQITNGCKQKQTTKLKYMYDGLFARLTVESMLIKLSLNYYQQRAAKANRLNHTGIIKRCCDSGFKLERYTLGFSMMLHMALYRMKQKVYLNTKVSLKPLNCYSILGGYSHFIGYVCNVILVLHGCNMGQIQM